MGEVYLKEGFIGTELYLRKGIFHIIKFSCIEFSMF